MSPTVVVTIHTECDKDEKWKIRYPISFQSVVKALPQYLEKIFRKFDVKPTFLISAEVFGNKECVEVMTSQRAYSELGAHFHGEFLEPGRRLHPLRTQDYGCLYKEDVEYAKLVWLTNRFKETFGFQPVSFSAGLWGASGRTATFLDELKYLVDSSVVSFMERKHLGSKEDILNETGAAYFPSSSNIGAEGNLGIVEIPVTALPSENFHKNYFRGVKLIHNFFKKNQSKKHLIWLRPTFSSISEMKLLVEKVLSVRNTKSLFNIMFHSFEILPGLSPYAASERASSCILNRLERLLEYLKESGFNFLTLEEAARDFINRNKKDVFEKAI